MSDPCGADSVELMRARDLPRLRRNLEMTNLHRPRQFRRRAAVHAVFLAATVLLCPGGAGAQSYVRPDCRPLLRPTPSTRRLRQRVGTGASGPESARGAGLHPWIAELERDRRRVGGAKRPIRPCRPCSRGLPPGSLIGAEWTRPRRPPHRQWRSPRIQDGAAVPGNVPPDPAVEVAALAKIGRHGERAAYIAPISRLRTSRSVARLRGRPPHECPAMNKRSL
jgi:hypothetical protein